MKRDYQDDSSFSSWYPDKPEKQINTEIKYVSRICSVKCSVLKLRILAFPGGPGGFRELREAGRNHFILSWYLVVPGITSYGQDRGGAQDTDCNKGFTEGFFLRNYRVRFS